MRHPNKRATVQILNQGFQSLRFPLMRHPNKRATLLRIRRERMLLTFPLMRHPNKRATTYLQNELINLTEVSINASSQ